MKSFFIVTFWSILNKFFGMMRVRLTQQLLGASAESDGFHFAFRMIGFFRSLFTDGSFYSFFTSYFAKYNKKEEQFGFALGVMVIFSSIFIGLNILAVVFPIGMTKIFTFNKQSLEKTLLISRYAKYMFPIPLSMFLTSLFSGILNSYKEFFHSSIGLVVGSLANVSLIYLGISSPHYFYYLVAGTVSYSLVHAIYMGLVIYIKHLRKIPNVKIIIKKEFFSKVSTIGMTQIINNLIYILMGLIFVSMKTGSYSYVEYSERITYFVFTLVAGNLSSVISPVLSSAVNDDKLFQKLCNKFISMTLFLCIFPTVFILIHSDIVTNAIYTANAKTNLDLISIALKHAIFATPFWCLQRVFLTVFLSRGQLKEQNIANIAYKVITLAIGIFAASYDTVGVIWSMNLGVILVVTYLIIVAHYKRIFRVNWDTLLQLSIKIGSSYILLKYLFVILPTHWNMISLLVKVLLLYIVYCGICYKDIKLFLNKE